uniref:polymerase delta-interacting protein 2-like isoform X1 n=1 Tax=Styela clava TaxID=7725 RepID=UPI00193A0205|nr:polymerase delta-interacting protein 2-like isoform X1 [Styela clava]
MDKCKMIHRIGLRLLADQPGILQNVNRGSSKKSVACFTTLQTPKKPVPFNEMKKTYICNTKRYSSSKPKLESVGKFETPKTEGRYETGQLFLHKVFGYRGVILFPWSAQLYERDKSDHTDGKDRVPEDGSSGKQVIARTLTYYQTLVDSRDCPHINAQSEAVTFLGNNERGQSLYTIPGLDYVSQEDILPYTTSEKIPIHHELFDKFLSYDPKSSKLPQATKTLITWQEKNHMCLELSKVHQETTGDIRVTAMPFFLGAKDNQNMHEYWWRYLIRIENFSNTTVQLRERHWKTYEVHTGRLGTISGRGVVGLEPVLSKQQPAFQYSSHVSLHSPTGHMWGMFRMERPDGTQFDVRIPAYALESKIDPNSDNGPHGYHGS